MRGKIIILKKQTEGRGEKKKEAHPDFWDVSRGLGKRKNRDL